MVTAIFMLAVVLASPLSAEHQREWQDGVLKDVTMRVEQSTTSDFGTNHNKWFTYTIEGGGKTYVAEHVHFVGRQVPLDIEVNSPVKFAAEKNYLYLLGPDGKERRMNIIKRVKNN